MSLRFPAAVMGVAASFLTGLGQAVADEDKEAQICAEAAERYVELFGHAHTDVEEAEVVLMYRYRFCPAELTVPVGTTVRWVNVDKRNSHSVVLPGEPESDRAFPEETIEFTFLTTGDLDYLCGPHWESNDMLGVVRVVEP